MGEWWMEDRQIKMEPHDVTDLAPSSTHTPEPTLMMHLSHPNVISASDLQQNPTPNRSQASTREDEPCQSRSRANTWPLNQVEKNPDGERPPLPTLLEEENGGGGCGGSGSSSTENLSQAIQSGGGNALVNAKKKNSARRNPWGNMSYADLIERSIETAPDKRLTLSQIYDWLVQNIPYFKEKADTNSSAGWKNSVRHNLSLHNRFMRVANETGTGKSSWWMVNQSAKFDKPSRRRAASMEPKEYEKARKGRMKKSLLREREELSRTISPSQVANDSGLAYQHLSVTDFRSRASSNASSYGGAGCISPHSPGGLDDQPSPGLSPQSGSTGYDSTGSIGRLSAEYCFPYSELDFAHHLAQNARISAPASFEFPRHPTTCSTSNSPAIGNYHPLATNGFYETTRAFFSGQFPSIPEEPRVSQYYQTHQQTAPPLAKGLSSTVLAESGVSGGNFTTFNGPATYGYHQHWSLPQDLESFAEPVQSFDFDWEELLQQEAAIERTMQQASASTLAPSNGSAPPSGRFSNADTK